MTKGKCTEASMLMLCTGVIDFSGAAPGVRLLRGSGTRLQTGRLSHSTSAAASAQARSGPLAAEVGFDIT